MNRSWRTLVARFRRLLGIDNLAEREKRVLLAGLAFVGCFLVLQVVIMPFVNARAGVEEAILRREGELREVERLRQEYLSLKQEEGGIQAGVERRQADFSLFTFLDQQAEKSQLKRQISSMKPSSSEGEGELNEVMVEIKMQQVSMERLVDFLLLVESEEEVVFVRRISIQEAGRAQGFLDVTLQVVTFERKG